MTKLPRSAQSRRAGAGSRIHAGLVGPRELIGTAYLRDPDLRHAYDVEIAPRTRAALGRIFAEVLGRGDAGRTTPGPRVLDLGAGTGAAAEAARAFFGASTEVVSVDRVGGPGIVTADLAVAGPVPGVRGRFDVVLAAHLVNELFTERPAPARIAARAQKLLQWCEALLAPQGTFIVLEPALRETSRELLAVRDQLLGAGLRVVAPCFWSGPCPALTKERDWCHDATPPQPDAGGRTRRVDFSYLALRRGGGAQPDVADPASGDPALVRIVSDPLVEKGRLRLFGCGPAGREALVRLDRHRAESNRAFDELARGDAARVVGTTAAADGRRVGPETVVELRRSG
jgi:SAM-dependent methyltransferase